MTQQLFKFITSNWLIQHSKHSYTHDPVAIQIYYKKSVNPTDMRIAQIKLKTS